MNNDLYMGQGQFPMNGQQTPVNSFMSNSQNTYPRPADIVDYVNGYNGMANYPIPMGRTGILFDFPNRKFWIKSPGGPQPVLGFNFSPDNYPMNAPMQQQLNQPMLQAPSQDNAVTREEFDELKGSINQITSMLSAMQPVQNDQQVKQNNKKFNNQKG